MQVAMRLGPYWWKILGKKKVYNSTVRKCFLRGISLLTTVIVGLLGLWITESLGLADIAYYHYYSSADNIKSTYQLIAELVVGSGALFVLISVIHLAGSGVMFVRSLIATLRFRTIFGFSPPVTVDGHEALESTIRYMLSIRAHALDTVYEHEKEMIESIKKRVTHYMGTWDWLKSVGTYVTSIEHDMCNWEIEKKQAKKEFYSARDAARNPSLPLPYNKEQLPDSFKEYLPKKEKAA